MKLSKLTAGQNGEKSNVEKPDHDVDLLMQEISKLPRDKVPDGRQLPPARARSGGKVRMRRS